jgi:hypothetical protein
MAEPEGDGRDKDRAGARAAGCGTNTQPALPQRARIEWAFARVKEMAEAAKLSERQRRLVLLYAAGLTDAEIGAELGIGLQAIQDSMKCATKHIAREFPVPEDLLPWVNRGDLVRCARNRMDPEPNPEWEDLEPGEGETTAIHGRPYGMCPADLAGPRPGTPAHTALQWHRLLFRLRQVTAPERARARVADVPRPLKPAIAEAARKRRQEARAARRVRRRTNPES